LQLPRQRKPGADHVEGDHAYDEGHVANRDGWGRKLKPFRGVGVAKVAYLTVAQRSGSSMPPIRISAY